MSGREVTTLSITVFTVGLFNVLDLHLPQASKMGTIRHTENSFPSLENPQSPMMGRVGSSEPKMIFEFLVLNTTSNHSARAYRRAAKYQLRSELSSLPAPSKYPQQR